MSEGTAVQDVAGPGGVTVAVPMVGGVSIAGELTVSWTADPLAATYCVFQSAQGGAFSSVACLAGQSGGSPPTTWTATGLTGGAGYCYSIQSGYDNGTVSDPGATGCGTAVGPGLPAARTVVVPVVQPTIDAPRVQLFATVSGLGSGAKVLTVPLMTTVGDTLDGLRVRVQDDGAGGRAQAQILSTSDNSESFTIVMQTAMSSGTGAEESINLSGAGIHIAPNTHYYVSVFNSAGGTATDRVYRLDLDYR
jgi:hypothetical protein